MDFTILALLFSLCKTSCTIVVCSKREAWWLISALNAAHLASLPARLCPLLQLWVTNLQTWGCQQESPWWGVGGIWTQRQASKHVHPLRNIFFPSTSHTISHVNTHSFYPSSFQPLSLSLSPSHTRTQTRHLTSTGIRSFYRVAVCWRGRRCGRAVSPSSDWILDQYPVPRQPASLGWTGCIWKAILVHVCRLVKKEKKKKGLGIFTNLYYMPRNFLTSVTWEAWLHVGCSWSWSCYILYVLW